MRTGKERTFAIDQDQQKSSQELAEKGKGLVGGDIERIPHLRQGLSPYLKFKPEYPLEIRHFPETEQEREEQQLFLHHRPLDVEVGFAGGHFMLHHARNHPDTHCVAFEIRRHYCLDLATAVHHEKLHNLRVVYEDVRQALSDWFADGSIRRCCVFFPDPWWKKRHLKRRVLTPFFLDLMAQKLQHHGILHIKTDVLPYAEVIRDMVAQDPRYHEDDGTYQSLFAQDQPTEREAYCLEHNIPFAEFRWINLVES